MSKLREPCVNLLERLRFLAKEFSVQMLVGVLKTRHDIYRRFGLVKDAIFGAEQATGDVLLKAFKIDVSLVQRIKPPRKISERCEGLDVPAHDERQAVQI